MIKNITHEEALTESVFDLVKRIDAEYEKKKKEAEALQKKYRMDLKAAVQEEKELIAKIDKEKKIAQKMQQDYLELETEKEREKKGQVEKGILREADVRSGKVSLREFNLKGKMDKQISDEILERTTKEMEQSLKIVRAKNLEILKLEKSLCETQNRIRGLILAPARILQRAFKDSAEIADLQIGELLADVYGSRDALKQAEHKLLLTEGKSLTPGFSWDRLNMDEARAIIFSPILPLELVPKLKGELEKFKDAEKLHISFYLKSNDIVIRSPRIRSKKDE